MTRERFESIKHAFRITSTFTTEVFTRLEPFNSHLKNKFREYFECGSHVTVDECIVTTQDLTPMAWPFGLKAENRDTETKSEGRAERREIRTDCSKSEEGHGGKTDKPLARIP